MQKVKKRRYRKALFTLIVLIGIGGLAYWAYNRPLPVSKPALILNQSSALQSASPGVSWSPYGEQAIAIIGQNLIANYGNQNPLPVASIAKIMTALAILYQRPLKLGQQGPSMTIGQNDVATYQQELAQNESVVQVSAGEQLSEYQMLEAMLVPSSTNVADSAAVWAFGSISSYLAFANHYALQLGLDHTHFAVDASGFSPATVSTPQDLIRLGEVALTNPVIRQIVSQSSITLPVAGTLQNFNIDLGDEGIVGIKTGNTDEAGGAFLFAARYQSFSIIGAILGAPDLGTALHDAPEILSSFESSVQTEKIINSGQEVASYKLPWGGSIEAVAEKPITITEWANDKPGIQVSVNLLQTGQHAGTTVGTVKISYRGTTIATPVVLKNSLPSPSIWWRISHL
ncbi:MAG TPA: hypothetical protein VGS08_03765 [Candidatus Saccharimonadales bacterium]|nr:hypothetical protein [Candidatus Saccharimonadales bacterium]